jgi:hypothetical protein
MRRFYVALLIAVLAQNLIAQEAGQEENTELLQFYDNELFHWNYGFGLALNFRHVTSSITGQGKLFQGITLYNRHRIEEF